MELINSNELKKLNVSKIKSTENSINKCLDLIDLTEKFSNETCIDFDEPLPECFLQKLRNKNYIIGTIDIKNKTNYHISWNVINPIKFNERDRIISLINFYGKYFGSRYRFIITNYTIYSCQYNNCNINNMNNLMPENFKKELENKKYTIDLILAHSSNYRYRTTICKMGDINYINTGFGLYRYVIKW